MDLNELLSVRLGTGSVFRPMKYRYYPCSRDWATLPLGTRYYIFNYYMYSSVLNLVVDLQLCVHTQLLHQVHMYELVV